MVTFIIIYCIFWGIAIYKAYFAEERVAVLIIGSILLAFILGIWLVVLTNNEKYETGKYVDVNGSRAICINSNLYFKINPDTFVPVYENDKHRTCEIKNKE